MNLIILQVSSNGNMIYWFYRYSNLESQKNHDKACDINIKFVTRKTRINSIIAINYL